MLQLSPDPASPYVNLLNIGARRRTLAIGLTIFFTGMLLIMLLSLRLGDQPEKEEVSVSVVSIAAREMSQEAPAPDSAAQQRSEAQPVPPQPTAEQPVVQPTPADPLPPPIPPPPVAIPNAAPSPPAPARIGVRAPDGRTYGPPNTGASRGAGDSERVGTAPNGEALYAAAWYREPTAGELRGYLSTADGPGWGLIACRTAPDYRVEDCVGLDEYPSGAQINRAVLAAAWQFRVRPPRVGGKSMVGSWVRIRIDYRTKRG